MTDALSLRPLGGLLGLFVIVGCSTPPAEPAAGAPTAQTAAPTVQAAAAPASAPVASAAGRPGTAPAAAPAAPAPTATPPGTPPPFAAVIRDAKKIDGPIVAWQKDDKVWIELAPADFGRALLLSPKLATGIGQPPLVGGMFSYPASGVGGAQLVEFVRVHNTVRLLARNTDVTAPAGSPEARALAASYSPSLLGSVPVASQPHPQSKSVLVEANGLFLTDMLGVAMILQRTWRQGYAFDARNSVITSARATPTSLEIETQNHYAAASIATPVPGAPPGAPVPSWPSYVPDSRSLFVGHHYSLVVLPEQPMRPRRSDPRVGLMTQSVLDFGDDLARSPRVRWVERWRLEKKDPAAELSEPVKPITFWIDRNVPLKYRDVVAEGILEWNKAFERIGFKDAIVVRQQPDDADWSTLDAGRTGVRWMMSAELAFGAIGPKHVDPRSGEIVDALVGFESLSSRSQRALRRHTLAGAAQFASMVGGVPMPDSLDRCMHAEIAAEQLSYALDVLEARGELDADGVRTEQFVRDYVKDTVMHEVGHVLGLRHNFRASRAYTEEQLADPEFTRTHGTSGSVMEYNAINLARPGRRGGVPFQIALGPYDYWAIEYAYKPIEADDERAELRRIAARGSDPLLAYGTDEDAAFGIDPETIQLDLGADPIAYASKRLEIARDLFQRQETRTLDPNESYAVLRRSLAYAIGDTGRAVGVLARQIGGVRTLRDYPGSGRDPLVPTPAQTQREALDLIARHVLSIDGLKVSPALQRRLAPDFDDRFENPGIPTDYPVPQRLLDLQRAVLAHLMSDATAARILDSVDKADRPAQAFQLSELYARLSLEVWSELARPVSIAPPRRDLQREYLNRVAAAIVRPAPTARADARALQRAEAQRLLRRIESALERGTGLDAATRAHLVDGADTLRQAIEAKTTRPG